jgi:hypothetical protein
VQRAAGLAEGPKRSSLALAGLIVTVVSLALFAGTIGLIEWDDWSQRSAQLASGKPSKQPLRLGRAILFFGGYSAGAVVGLVGVVFCACGLGRRPRKLALWGLALGLLGAALAIGWVAIRLLPS